MNAELGVASGQIIAGKYQLVELLGKGGMGSVWRAKHLTLLSQVAVKVIKPDVAKNNANAIARFLREAKAAAMLRSPHVVQVLDQGQEGDIAFIVMELLEGENLHQRLKRDGKLSPEVTQLVMTHVGRAIARAHETGIVHRDLKPENIFLVKNEDEILAKVLDFGVAKTSLVALNQTGRPDTQTGTVLGTPYYMSPEQATGQKEVDLRTDLWALGVIAYECLLGARPYSSTTFGELVLQICGRPPPVPSEHGEVPPGFDAWYARSQERDPEDRFQSAKEMIAALKDALSRPAEPVSDTPTTRAAPMADLDAPSTEDAPSAEAPDSERRPAALGTATTLISEPDAPRSTAPALARKASAETIESPGVVRSRRPLLLIVAIAAVIAVALGAQLLRGSASAPPAAPATR